MPIVKTFAARFCQPILMWVMLLWAFTLPGQEVAVYNFLITGEVAYSVFEKAGGDRDCTVKVKARAVSAFPDAKPSSWVASVLKKAGPVAPSFLSFLEAFLPANLFPPYTSLPPAPTLLAQLFLLSLQPNAP